MADIANIAKILQMKINRRTASNLTECLLREKRGDGLDLNKFNRSMRVP